MGVETAYNALIDFQIATEDELILVTDIWGYNLDTLEKVLYARTALTSFYQLIEEEENE